MKKIYVDATNKSVAMIHGEFSLNIPVPPNNNIIYQELLAIYVGLKYAASYIDRPLTIYTDNKFALDYINGKPVIDPHMKVLLMEIGHFVDVVYKKAGAITIRYIYGKENKADQVSRKINTPDWHNQSFLYA